MEVCITGYGIRLFIHFFYKNILLQVYPCSLCEISFSSDKSRRQGVPSEGQDKAGRLLELQPGEHLGCLQGRWCQQALREMRWRMKKPYQPMKGSAGRNPLRNNRRDISVITPHFASLK